MDANEDIAEERLLRVIEKGQARNASVALGVGKQSNLLKLFRAWFVRSYARPVGKDSDSVLTLLRSLSMILWVALVGFGIYFVTDLVTHDKLSFQKQILETRKTSSSKSVATTVEDEIEKPKPDSYYMDAVQNPNPFTGTSEEVKVVETNDVRGPTPSEKLAELTKGLVVVGINRGLIPDAIIENAEQKRTFFVKAGDKINDLTVKEVKHSTVVLSYEGAEIEIG